MGDLSGFPSSGRGDEDVGMLDYDEDKAMIRKVHDGSRPKPLRHASSLHKMASQDPTSLDNNMNPASLDAKDEQGLTLLHHAVILGHAQMVERLLEDGASVGTQNRLGRTALHLAVWTGNLSLCSQLCDNALGSKRRETSKLLETCDVYGQTALHWSAHKGSQEIVRLLLDHGASVIVQDQHGLTPVHIAADQGQRDALDELLLTKTDKENLVNMKDNSGSTALHHCALKGHGECISQLLEAGAAINEVNQEDDTPAHIAAARPDTNTLSLLIDAGADLSIKNKLWKTPAHSMAAWGHHVALEKVSNDLQLLNAPDCKGKTLMHMAASWGHANTLQVFLAAGLDVNSQDDVGMTPLHYAAFRSKPLCVKLLLNAGADTCITSKEGRTPLHEATHGGDSTCVTLLLNNDIIDAQQNDGQTALQVSALSGKKTIMEKLLSSGASVHITDHEGRTVLHCLVQRGASFEVLKPYDPDISARDKRGRTALHHAVKNGNVQFASQLIQDLEADVNAEDNDGMTPLHFAVYNASLECTQLLIQNKADVGAKDKERRFVVHHAAMGGNEKSLALLQKHRDGSVLRRDWLRQMALHYAAKLGHTNVVNTLLEHPQIRVNVRDKHNDTPLHLAVQNGHNNVVYALVNSGKADLSVKNNQGKLAIDIAYVCYNKEIFQFLLTKITTRYDDTWMNEFLTNTVEKTDRMRDLVRSEPESARVVFDGCIKKTPDQQECVSIDFQYLDDLHKNPSMDKSNHTMHILASYGNKQLLSHPLLLLCLKKKWRVAFIMYLLFLAYYLAYLILFVIHMLSATPSFSPINDDGNTSAYFTASPYILYTLSTIGILVELIQFGLTGKQYIEWHNLLDWLSYIGTIIVITTDDDSGLKRTWQRELGCIVVLLQCMNFLFFLRVFPRFGIYVVMVSIILKTFIESFIVLFLFIVAFAITFYLLLFNQYAFSTPGYSLVKSLVMMLGEIDFGTIFHAYKEDPTPENTLNFEVMTYAVLCGFLLISIIIVNLLTGLAVSDVQMLRENSESEVISMQIDLALNTEFALFKWRNLHQHVYDKQTSTTMSTTRIDMKQLHILQRWKHAILEFFQGPLYRQDIIRKMVLILDEREYTNSNNNKQNEVSPDVKYLAKTVLDILDTKGAHKESPSRSNVLQVKGKPEAWADSAEGENGQETNRQRHLELKVDLLSKDVKECMTMLKTILKQK